MTEIDVSFCFYDDPDFATDADRDSRLLRSWHQRLWSKPLPSGEKVVWDVEPSGTLAFQRTSGVVRVSSDTIATTHARYGGLGMPQLWAQISEADQSRLERAYYTIGGFIIFPVRPQSLNQSRGTRSGIADRFDLTLECIRQHYVGERDNPLADVLDVDADYFRMFGEGLDGFVAFVDFFHLQDLIGDGSIRWFDDSAGSCWDFSVPPLPRDLAAYRGYLDKVAEFVAARNLRIDYWVQTQPSANADQVQ